MYGYGVVQHVYVRITTPSMFQVLLSSLIPMHFAHC